MTSLIAGILPIMRDDWSLSSNQQELLVSSAIAGAFIGAFIGARTVNRIGRKNSILIAAIIFILSSISCSLSQGIINFSFCRFFIGISIGLSSITIPIYITEISPSRNRAALMTLHQLMITLGILFAYLNSLILLQYNDNWRWITFSGIIPSIILCIAMLFMPKTPKWLIMRGRYTAARSALLKIEENDQVETTMDLLKQEIETENTIQTRWRDMFRSSYLIIMIMSIVIMFIQQFTGINIIIYYSPILFELSGFKNLNAELTGTILIGLVNVFFTVVSISLLDYFGRKSLFLVGLSVMTVMLCSLGVIFYFYNTPGEYLKWIILILCMIYVIFFSVSLGPITWILAAELFPSRIKTIGMNISIMFNWLFNFCVVYSFFKMSKKFALVGHEYIIQESNKGIVDIYFNPAINFFIYSLFAIIGFLIVYFMIPETKGLTNLDIDEYWLRRFNKKAKLKRE